MRSAVVIRVVREPDRVLLFIRPDYHIIAPADVSLVAVGDRIRYEPCGVNFGWYLGPEIH